jgi:endogenous inhibitor of DNA gyrase (YacG/DUF329 family)
MLRLQSGKKPRPRKCPVCRRAATEDFNPFCSKRCADADLTRWLKGAYAIPGEPVSEDELTSGEAETESTPTENLSSPPKPKN